MNLRSFVWMGVAALVVTTVALTGCKPKDAGNGGGDAGGGDAAPATTVPTDAGTMNTEDLQDAVVLTFSVSGMTCGGCVAAVQEKIAMVDGVKACEVTLEEETAVVYCEDPALTDAIVKAVYEAAPDGKFTATPKEG